MKLKPTDLNMNQLLKNRWNIKIYFRPGSWFYERSDEAGKAIMNHLKKRKLNPTHIIISNKDDEQ